MLLLFPVLSKAGANNKADIVVEASSRVKVVDTTVGSNVTDIVVVTEELGRVAPRSDGVTSGKTGLRAESGVFLESLGVVVLVKLEDEVVVSDEASGGVDGFKGVAVAVTETGTDSPAGLLLQGGGAG